MFSSSRIYTNFYKCKRKLLSHVFAQQCGKACHSQGKALKILFFGTDFFSLPSLRALYNCNDVGDSLGAVTSFKSPANCVRVFAECHQVQLYSWPVDELVCRRYDLGVVVSFGHLIPERLIRAFHFGMINVHASLLPRWRGAAPIIYAIMHGDPVTGVSVMRIEPNHFDVGDILAQRPVPIKSDVFMPELHLELANEGALLLTEVVTDFPKSLANAKKQDNATATFAPKISDAIIEVSWSQMESQQIYNRHRALFGFKHLFTRFQRKQVQLVNVKLARLTPTKDFLERAKPSGSFIYNRERKCLLVCCARRSYIEVHKLRIEGKKVMSALDFKNGILNKLCTSDFIFEEQSLLSNNKTEVF